jgi:SAM-dependent methyltransferase
MADSSNPAAEPQAAPPSNERAKAMELLKNNSVEGWEMCYQSGNKPWDRGRVAPALAKLISGGTLPDGLAVVPGCGLGYDIAALASEKRRVIGVDIAPSAVEQASANIAGIKNAELRVADFFELDLDGQVDLLYDYTFLCALPLDWRGKWADKIAKLLKPGAVLVTLMFPLASVYSQGPPHPVSPQIYKDLLQERGFELTQFEETIESFPDRAGKESLGIWKRL